MIPPYLEGKETILGHSVDACHTRIGVKLWPAEAVRGTVCAEER